MGRNELGRPERARVTGIRRRPLMIGALIAAGITLVAVATVAVTTFGAPSPDLASGQSTHSVEAPHSADPTHNDEATHSSTGTPTSSSPATPAPSKSVVNVSLTDLGGPKGQGNGGYSPDAMGLTTDHATVPHGRVTFHVKNAGEVEHEMIILPLDSAQPIGARPFGGDAKIDESARLHEESHAEAHTSVSVTVTLAPGRYELVCNHAGHYVSGMYSQLTVT
jgi:uncharacterized cupredoxin-like copper-binding protein